MRIRYVPHDVKEKLRKRVARIRCAAWRIAHKAALSKQCVMPVIAWCAAWASAVKKDGACFLPNHGVMHSGREGERSQQEALASSHAPCQCARLRAELEERRRRQAEVGLEETKGRGEVTIRGPKGTRGDEGVRVAPRRWQQLHHARGDRRHRARPSRRPARCCVAGVDGEECAGGLQAADMASAALRRGGQGNAANFLAEGHRDHAFKAQNNYRLAIRSAMGRPPRLPGQARQGLPGAIMGVPVRTP